ncbi:MAG: GNAT family N-acetyltransferase [Planctomycetota bacterium]
MGEVTLRPVRREDFATLFEHQIDPGARRMCAFTREDTLERAGFDRHWDWILAQNSGVARAVLVDGRLAGNVVSFVMEDELHVSYWIDPEQWGRGIGRRALALLLAEVPDRPIFARIAKDNAGSLRVAEHCGFRRCGEDRAFAHGRGEEVEEWVLRLDG